MPVKSYLAHPHKGQLEALLDDLKGLEGCEVIPSTNEEVAVLVTDTLNEETDLKLVSQIQDLPSLKMLSMVSGFEVNS